MDKQKQIQTEELIGIIQGAVGGCATHWASLIAEEVLKYYQPKIHENEVVLTREEYDGKEIVVEMSGGHKLRLNVGKFGEMSKILEEYTRKETAKEIFQEAKVHFGEMSGDRKVFEKWLCKRYGIEVE